jgi:predicted ester cyclase
MALSPAQMDDKLDEHFAFEARDDLDGVLATLAPDAEHDVVGWPTGVTRGREGAGAFYETLFADLCDGSIETVRRLYGEDFVVDESLWRGRASGRPFGLDGRGRPLQFRLLHIFQFDGDGAIARENVWIDLAALINQLPQD